MNRKNSTRKALLLSCLSLLLCMSMLVGTTFAWFTDSVSTTNNIITAGNLDVNLYWSTNGADWTAVNANTNIFKTETLWEPGHTEVVYLKVVNEGTLALKYDLVVNVASEIAGKNVAGEAFKLSDYILYNVTNGITTYANSAEARGNEQGDKLNAPYNKASQLLEKGDEVELTMVVFMPTTVGNEANYLKGTAVPTINLGVSLFATQQVKEQDSYGPNYDASAELVVVRSPAELKDAIASGAAEIQVTAGTYTFPASSLSAGQTLVCAPGTVFEGTSNLNANGATIVGATFSKTGGNVTNSTSVNGTFKNCTFVGNNALRYCYAGNTVVFEDCVFTAKSVYAIHFDGAEGKDLTFKNCKITGWVSFAGGANSLVFDGCEFYGNGTYGLVRSYSNATIKNCTFDVSAVNTTDTYQDGIHAVGSVITVENCTNVNGAIEDIFNVSNSGVINKN